MSEPNANAPDELREVYSAPLPPLAPPDVFDPVIEAYKKDVDRTLIRQNLMLTPDQRARKFLDFARFAWELREAGRRAREKDPNWGMK